MTALALVLASSSAAQSVYTVLRSRNLSDWGPMKGFVMDDTIRFIREQIPADERVGAISSGIFTYFSGREIENLEGLVNGVDFFRASRDPATYADYLRRNRIRWIVFKTSERGERARYLAQFGGMVPIEHVYDLDSFSHDGMKQRMPYLADPNVCFLRLGIIASSPSH